MNAAEEVGEGFAVELATSQCGLNPRLPCVGEVDVLVVLTALIVDAGLQLACQLR